jgi:hypothetical protein
MKRRTSRTSMKKSRKIRRSKYVKKRSFRKNRKNRKSLSNIKKGLRKSLKKGSRLSLKKALIGTVGLAGTALVAKKMNINYNEKVIYEENVLVSDITEGSLAQWENLTNNDFEIRSKIWVKKSNEKKEKSSDILYDTFKVDIFKGKKLTSNVIAKKLINFPKIINETKLPDYFIVNAQLPLLQETNFSVVIVYKIKPSTIAAAKNPDSKPELKNAINLLTNFVTDYEKNRDRFKGIATIVDTGSLDIGYIGKAAISTIGLTKQKATILNKTVKKYENGKLFEIDVNADKFDYHYPITKDKISEYYDKTQKININVGFVIEGRNPDELPEVLLGGTKFLGLELITQNTESLFVKKSDKIKEIENLMNLKDIRTLEMGNAYVNNYINPLLRDLKTKKIQDIINELPLAIPNDNRTKSDNKKFFLFARYFYYKNLYNKNFELSSNIISYSAEPCKKDKNCKYISKGTCFGNDRIFNFYKCKNGEEVGDVQTFRFGFSIKNAFDETDFTKIVIDKMDEFEGYGGKFMSLIKHAIFNHTIDTHKNLVCISLLTPCNNMLCKAIKIGSKLLPKEGYLSFLENNIIDAENKAFNSLNDIFINVPLSSGKSGLLFTEGTKSVNPATAVDFEELIDISGPKETFETLVNITHKFYEIYRYTHKLCYHCKSGKDRCGICDSIVQATLYHIRIHGFKNDLTAENYEEIRILSQYFLLYGLIITFYSTGVPGIKLNNIPVATHILGPKGSDLYNFFLGNSRLSGS